MFSEMDKIIKALLVRLYTVKVEPVNEKYEVNSSAPNVVRRDVLHAELQRLNKKLFKTKIETLKLAHSQLLGGILASQRKEVETASEFFKLAAEYSADAFLESIGFAEKSLAARMRILIALYDEKCSELESSIAQKKMQDQCTLALDELVATMEVKKAIEKEIFDRRSMFAPSLTSSCVLGSVSSAKVLSELASIIHLAEEQGQFVYSIPTLGSKEGAAVSDTATASMHNVQAKLNGHKQRVTAVAAHSRYLFSGAKDSTIKVWDVNTLRLRATLRGHKGAVSALVVEGDTLFSGATDGTVRSWSVDTLKESGNSGALLLDYSVRSLAVDAASGSVFVGCNDGVIRVLNSCCLSESKGSMKGHSHWVSCMAVVASSGLLCSGSVDSTIKLWDIESLMCVGTLMGHSGFITSLAVSGGKLFSGGFDKTLKVWDLNTLSEIEAPEMPKSFDSAVRSLAVTRNRLYVSDASDNIRVISLSSLSQMSKIQAKPTSFDNCMTVSDGKLFIGSAGKTIHVHLI